MENKRMKFETLEELQRISELLAEGDFERADIQWDPSGAVFTLKTSRPRTERLKGGGLFRKPQVTWTDCRLVIRHVRGVSLWEEFDAKPPLGRFLELEQSQELSATKSSTDKPADGLVAGLFKIRLGSAHGLRVELSVKPLEGVLEELEEGGVSG